MKKVALWGVMVLFVGLVGCAGPAQKIDPVTGVAELVFEEIHPDNQGTIAPKVIKWRKWTWHQDLHVGDVLVAGQHYRFVSEQLPAGLSLEIEVTGQRSGLIHLRGAAANHHVNQSVRGLQLQFLPQAFLAGSKNALNDEQIEWAVGVQFGKGYTLSGQVAEADGVVVLREMLQDQVIEIKQADGQFAFAGLYEEDEHFVIQIENHPEGQCCKFIEAEGQLGSANINNLHLSCHKPQWHHPVDERDTFISSPFDSISDIQSRYNATYFSHGHNRYGDIAIGYRKTLKDSVSHGFFVSKFNQNTQKWDHPEDNYTYDSMNILVKDPNNILPFTTGNSKFKNVHIFDNKNIHTYHSQNFSGSGVRFFSNIYENKKWKKPASLLDSEPNSLNISYYTQEKILQNGDILRAWISNDNQSAKIQRKINGQWESAQTISPVISGVPQGYYFFNLVLLVNESGSGAVFWELWTRNDWKVSLMKADIENFEVVTTPEDRNDIYSPEFLTVNQVRYAQSGNGNIMVAFAGNKYDSSGVEADERIYYVEKVQREWIFIPTVNQQLNSIYENKDLINKVIVDMNSNGDVAFVWEETYGYADSHYINELYAMVKRNNVWYRKQVIKSVVRQQYNSGSYNFFEFVDGEFEVDISENGKVFIGLITEDRERGIFDYDVELITFENGVWSFEQLEANVPSNQNTVGVESEVILHSNNELHYFYKKNNHLYLITKNLIDNAWGSSLNISESTFPAIANVDTHIGHAEKSNQCGLITVQWGMSGSNFNRKDYISQYR